MAAAEMLVERLAHPAPLVGARHPVAAKQLLLLVDRKSCDLPAHRQSLEQELRAIVQGFAEDFEVVIEADPSLHYGYVVRAVNATDVELDTDEGRIRLLLPTLAR